MTEGQVVPGPQAAPRGRRPVISGLGVTSMGRVYGSSSAQFAADAVRLAAADAGLSLRDIDGLLVSAGVDGGVDLDVHRDLGLRDLRLLSQMQSFGATAAAMVQVASGAVMSGAADAVACVFADAPLVPERAAGSAYRDPARFPSGWRGIVTAGGATSATSLYALAARRHMIRFGTTSEMLGHIAVAQRSWAALNPAAQLQKPITLRDHQDSRWVVEPLHLLDCCLVSNGGVAVIVTSLDRARDLPRPPVHVRGWAQSHPGTGLMRDENFGIVSGAARSGPEALRMAGVALSEVGVAELYDCYTFTVLLSLEDYGFCAKGEGGPFVASGVLGPSGTLRLNTGGGQLSGYYMWGMTPLAEAVIQVRGEAGERQAPDHDIALVSGNGGILDHHATLILGTEAR